MDKALIIAIIALKIICLSLIAYIIISKLAKKKDQQDKSNYLIAFEQIFLAVYSCDLVKNKIKPVTQTEYMDSVIPAETSFDIALKSWLNSLVAEHSKADAKKFFDFSTLQERLRNVDSISIDLCMANTGWECETIVVQKRNKKGLATKCLLLCQDINGPKALELSESQRLRQKSLSALSDNRMKSEFLSTLSHDLRTPMSAIMGFAQLAQRSINRPERMSDCIDKILISCNHLSDLLDDVMDMSHMKSGTLSVNETRNRISEILQGILPIIQSQATEKKMHLSTDTSKITQDFVYVDAVKIRRVLVNILGNSLKFTPENGSISIEVIQYTTTDSQTAGYQFKIKDNGIGMSQDFINRVYSLEDRLENPEALEDYDSSLSYTKKIIESMGGTINIEGIKNKGTTFTIDLVLRLQEAHIDKSYIGAKASVQDICQNKRILVVEDNELNREITIELLQEAGFVTDSAADGQEAVDKLSASSEDYYDLVLMDITMPVMDGYTATTQIRNMTRKDLRDIPIIAMTANTFEDDKLHALACGMNDHLSKPVDIRNLKAAIINQL